MKKIIIFATCLCCLALAAVTNADQSNKKKENEENIEIIKEDREEDSDKNATTESSFCFEENTEENYSDEIIKETDHEETDEEIEEECKHDYISEHVEPYEDIPYCHEEKVCSKCGDTIICNEDISDQCPSDFESEEETCQHEYDVVHGEEGNCTEYCCYETKICKKCMDTVYYEIEPAPNCINRKE